MDKTCCNCNYLYLGAGGDGYTIICGYYFDHKDAEDYGGPKKDKVCERWIPGRLEKDALEAFAYREREDKGIKQGPPKMFLKALKQVEKAVKSGKVKLPRKD